MACASQSINIFPLCGVHSESGGGGGETRVKI